MGTNATPKSADDSKVNAAVIGAGVGLAAGFAAPLLAGVALSAVGFTSTGIAAGSLADSWKESGSSFFRVLQSAAEGGLSSTLAAGLGAAFGTAAAVVTLYVKGKKSQPSESKTEHINNIVENGEKTGPIKEYEEEPTCPIVEYVTLKAFAPSDKEAKLNTMKDAQAEPDIKPETIVKDENVTEAEEQIVHVTFVPQQKSLKKDQTVTHDVKPAATQETAPAVEEVVVEAVIKLASVYQPEKCEIDEASTEKSEAADENCDEFTTLQTEAVILAVTSPTLDLAAPVPKDDVVHHATKPEEEAKLLVEAVEQLIESETLTEKLSAVEELGRDGERSVSEEIEILTTSGISSPVMNNSITTSLFQELTEEDAIRASTTNDPVSASVFQVLSLEDTRTEPTSETTCEIQENVRHDKTGHVESTEETSGHDTITTRVSEILTDTIQQVADQIISEIESVLMGSNANLSVLEANKPQDDTLKEVEISAQNKLSAEHLNKEDQVPVIDKNLTTEKKLGNFEIAHGTRFQEEEKETKETEDSHEVREQETTDEEDEAVESEEDKDNDSEKHSQAVSSDALVQNHSKAVE